MAAEGEATVAAEGAALGTAGGEAPGAAEGDATRVAFSHFSTSRQSFDVSASTSRKPRMMRPSSQWAIIAAGIATQRPANVVRSAT